MKKTLLLISLFLCGAIMVSRCVSVNGSSSTDSSIITIAYSGNVRGYLEPCG